MKYLQKFRPNKRTLGSLGFAILSSSIYIPLMIMDFLDSDLVFIDYVIHVWYLMKDIFFMLFLALIIALFGFWLITLSDRDVKSG